jgi:hypothetical protein
LVSVGFDADISGQGSAALSGGSNVVFAAAHVTTVGPLVTAIELAVPDRYLRFGWFAFGANFGNAGLPTEDYWYAPIWVDFTNFQWAPIPSSQGGAAAWTIAATEVRWSLGEGCAAHLYVLVE